MNGKMKIIRYMILFMLLSGCNLMTPENTQTSTSLQDIAEIHTSITQTPPIVQTVPASQIKQTEIASLATKGVNQPPFIPHNQNGPWFSSLTRFAVEPDRALARQMFPAGTKQIYAMWEYGNVRPDLTIRREWYRDG